MTPTVAILGSGPGYRDAPFTASDVEVWAPAQLWMFLPRFDRLFEIHDAEGWEPDHARQLDATGVPIVTREPHPDIARSEAFPFAEAAGLGPFVPASSFDYMIAFALLGGVTRIEMYGINMVRGTEYEHQRPSALHWLGFARGRGVDVWIHPLSALHFEGPAYGCREFMRTAARVA